MSAFVVIHTFISGCSGSSTEPSSKFSEGEDKGTKNIDGAAAGAIQADNLVCKTISVQFVLMYSFQMYTIRPLYIHIDNKSCSIKLLLNQDSYEFPKILLKIYRGCIKVRT